VSIKHPFNDSSTSSVFIVLNLTCILAISNTLGNWTAGAHASSILAFVLFPCTKPRMVWYLSQCVSHIMNIPLPVHLSAAPNFTLPDDVWSLPDPASPFSPLNCSRKLSELPRSEPICSPDTRRMPLMVNTQANSRTSISSPVESLVPRANRLASRGSQALLPSDSWALQVWGAS
jgi:hypothetical protein